LPVARQSCSVPRRIHGAQVGRPINTILYGQGADGIWRVSGDGGKPENVVKLTAGQFAHGPQLLPGGRAILFTLARNNDWDAAQIVVQSLDTGMRRVVLERGTDARYVSTGHLVYALGSTLLGVPFDVATLAVTGGPVPLVEAVARVPSRGPPGPGRWQVSTSGGTRPLWARNGRELFYESMGALMRVPVTTGSTFAAGTPSRLFDAPYFFGPLVVGRGRTYDVSPDGRRFLMIKEGSAATDEPAPSARLVLVQHWFEELKRRVPTK
jgi:hypothetical protein